MFYDLACGACGVVTIVETSVNLVLWVCPSCLNESETSAATEADHTTLIYDPARSKAVHQDA